MCLVRPSFQTQNLPLVQPRQGVIRLANLGPGQTSHSDRQSEDPVCKEVSIGIASRIYEAASTDMDP